MCWLDEEQQFEAVKHIFMLVGNKGLNNELQWRRMKKYGSPAHCLSTTKSDHDLSLTGTCVCPSPSTYIVLV